MLGNWLRKLLGSETPDRGRPEGDEDADASAAPDDTPNFLLRQPLLNRQQHIAGYLFSIQHPAGHRAWQASSEQFFDQALISRLNDQDIRRLTGGRPYLLALQPASLLLAELDTLAATRPILMLADANAIDPGKVNAIEARARSLREAGATLAAPDTLGNGPLSGLLADCAYLSLDASSMTPPDLLEHIRALRKHFPEAKLIATGVNSVELFDACKSLGFDLFDGHYLTARRDDPSASLNSQRMVVSQLISHLRRKDTDIDKLVLIARQDLALTFRLLRYINSAAMGLSTKVGSLKQAMVYIGREGLYRWLTLLLFYNSKSSPTDEALRETSLGRARMCELLAKGRMSPADTEQAFVTGMLSLVDVLFRMPMDKALAQLDLPQEIHLALARHEGRFGAPLALALACEKGDTATIERVGQPLGLSSKEINALYLQALSWAVEFDLGLNEDTPLAG